MKITREQLMQIIQEEMGARPDMALPAEPPAADHGHSAPPVPDVPFEHKGAVSKEDCCAAVMCLIECCSCPATRAKLAECCAEIMGGR